MTTKLKIQAVCEHCGSALIIPDDERKPYCLPCGRPYTEHNRLQDQGRIGGLQTYMRHGSSYMSDLGRLGGRPRNITLAEKRQQLAPEVQYLEGGNRLPNRLSELKGLYAAKIKRGSDC